MTFSTPEALVLAAAVLYSAAAIVLKRASESGAGSMHTTFVANVVTALFFAPLLLLGGTWHPELWWQPVIVALCFIAGQQFAFLSIKHGDVSVATPVLGIKILLVAFFVTLLGGETLRPKLWAAAALATVGIALLNRSGATAHHHVGRTIVTAGLSAAAFAAFDVLVQKWSPAWGLGRFLPLTLGLAGLMSFAFIPRFNVPLFALPRAAWPWLLGGTLLMASQAVLFVSTIANWGHAAPLNVIYASRGLWSVLLVWLCGHWVQSREQNLGSGVLAWRLAGAALMMSAIVLVLV